MSTGDVLWVGMNVCVGLHACKSVESVHKEQNKQGVMLSSGGSLTQCHVAMLVKGLSGKWKT